MEISQLTPVLGTTYLGAQSSKTDHHGHLMHCPQAVAARLEKPPKSSVQGLAQLQPFMGIPNSSQSRKYLKYKGLKSLQIQCAVAKRQETASMLPRSWIHVK